MSSTPSTTGEEATTKYQQALPFSLFPISPGLAALHASRIRSFSPSPSVSCPPDPSLCSKCGSFGLNGQVRLTRLRTKGTHKDGSQRRVLRRACRLCGWTNDTPTHKGNATLFPPSRHAANRQSSYPVTSLSGIRVKDACHEMPEEAQLVLLPSTLNDSCSHPPTAPPHPARSKARTNKRANLQDMLLRNREKEKQRLGEREKQPGTVGLAAFLDGL